MENEDWWQRVPTSQGPTPPSHIAASLMRLLNVWFYSLLSHLQESPARSSNKLYNFLQETFLLWQIASSSSSSPPLNRRILEKFYAFGAYCFNSPVAKERGANVFLAGRPVSGDESKAGFRGSSCQCETRRVKLPDLEVGGHMF